MSGEWCMEERCQHRHWRSGSMPTHRRGEDCPPTAHEKVAQAWHAGSDHAETEPFGGPLCNCWQVAERIMPMLAEAHNEGFYGRGLNPYEEDRHVDQ